VYRCQSATTACVRAVDIRRRIGSVGGDEFGNRKSLCARHARVTAFAVYCVAGSDGMRIGARLNADRALAINVACQRLPPRRCVRRQARQQ